jgi:putative oxidoreductase
VTGFRSRDRNRFHWIGSTSALRRWAPIPIRMIVGYGFVVHGYAKLARGPEHFSEILHVLGVPMPGVMSWVIIGVELIGGFAVLTGAFMRWFIIPMAAILLVSTFRVLLPYGFQSIELRGVTSTGVQLATPGYEVDLLYLACLAALILSGTGPLSLDNIIAKFKSTRVKPTRNKLRNMMSRFGTRKVRPFSNQRL